MQRLIRGSFFLATLTGGVALAQDPYQSGYTGERDVQVVIEEDRKDDPGPYALLGGGIEGYTGRLAPELNPGVAYGAHVGFRPFRGIGLELGYNGGLHDVDAGPGGVRDGADITRNAGQVAVVLDAPLDLFQPYVMGGIGLENHNVRGAEGPAAEGFTDDTSGYIPTGVGLRWNITDTIAADLRGTYNFQFEDDFAPVNTGAGSGRYQGLLQVGGAF